MKLTVNCIFCCFHRYSAFSSAIVLYQEPWSGTETVNLGIRAYLWCAIILLFLEQIAPSWRHISTRIHAHVVSSRLDVVTLRDQMVRVAKLSCGFFIVTAGNNAGKKNQALTCSFMLWAKGKGEFFRVENKISISPALWMNNKICTL